MLMSNRPKRNVFHGFAHARSGGQALVFTLVFATATCLIVLMLFNSSILANTKSQLQNAADAGAYSAAVLQARDQNFSAYTNRAMIANQVAVAQFVSLKSYVDDAAQTHTRANSFLHDSIYRFFPAAAPLWDVGVNVPVQTARSAVDSLAPIAVKALDRLIEGLDEAQQIHHAGTMAEMIFVADDVVKKNDPLAKVTTSAFMLGDAYFRVKNWGNDYTKQFRANDASKEADRFANAVVNGESEDRFIRNRSSVPSPAWLSTVKAFLCPGAAITFTEFAFVHGGGTILSSNKKRWLGLDATMGEGLAVCTWFVPCPIGTCPVVVTVPFPDIGTQAPFLGGHGGAQAGNGSGYGGEFNGFEDKLSENSGYGLALVNPVTAVPGYTRWFSGPGATLDDKGGLQKNYRDVRDPTNTSLKPKNQTPEENGGQFPIIVEVERPASTIRTSTKLLVNSDQLKIEDGMKGGTMRTLASAHAYFYRPRFDDLKQFTRNGWKRDDSKTEYENLFSPYWQAQLISTSAAEQAASALAQ